MGVPVMAGTGAEGLVPTGTAVNAGKDGVIGLAWAEQADKASESTKKGRMVFRITGFSWAA
jgi:hypothetical protein